MICWFRPVFLAAGALICAGAAAEEADPLVKVVEIAALAEIAPTVCPEVETRKPTLMLFLGRAGLSQEDLSGRYAEQARSIAVSFLASVREDQPGACAQIAAGLGDDGLGLLGRKAP